MAVVGKGKVKQAIGGNHAKAGGWKYLERR
jgi:hypothetical protein